MYCAAPSKILERISVCDLPGHAITKAITRERAERRGLLNGKNKHGRALFVFAFACSHFPFEGPWFVFIFHDLRLPH